MTPGNYLTPTTSLLNFMTADPFRLLNRPTRIFDEPFTMFRPFLPIEETLPFSAWKPPVDIFETDKDLVLKMELPEVNRENVHVTVENNALTIRGERKFEDKVDRENYHRIERTYGEFIRSFTLPSFVDGQHIKAEFKDGILKITLPKNEAATPKQIEVTVK